MFECLNSCTPACLLDTLLTCTSIIIIIIVSELVSWCFEPSQPQGIISEQKEIFIKRHIVERINKAEVRPEEQSEKTESCRKNFWNVLVLWES